MARIARRLGKTRSRSPHSGQRERVLPSQASRKRFVPFVKSVAAFFVQFVRFVASFVSISDAFQVTRKERPNLPLKLTEYPQSIVTDFILSQFHRLLTIFQKSTFPVIC